MDSGSIKFSRLRSTDFRDVKEYATLVVNALRYKSNLLKNRAWTHGSFALYFTINADAKIRTSMEFIFTPADGRLYSSLLSIYSSPNSIETFPDWDQNNFQ